MARGKKKEYIPQTFKMDAGLVLRLDSYSDRTGVSKTFVVEKAVERYLDENGGSDGAAGGSGASDE